MLDDKYSMIMKEAISLMILCGPRGRMKWLAIYFENTPFALVANQEVCFSIPSAFWRTEASFAVR